MLFNSVSFHFLLIAKRVLEIRTAFWVAFFFYFECEIFTPLRDFGNVLTTNSLIFWKKKKIAKTRKNTSIFLVEIDFFC